MKIEMALSGVGGQEVITMGMVLGACVKRGVNIVTAEAHGVAQRMGAVEFFIRIGDVEAQLVPIALADYVVALEMIVSLRAIRYLKKYGWSKASDKDGFSRYRRHCKEVGSPRVANMTMPEALPAFEDVSKVVPVHIAEDAVQKTLEDVNGEALIMEYEEALKKLSKGIDTYISKSCTD